MMELADRRVVAGFRCVDAITSSSIRYPLSVTATQLTLQRTASGVFAVMNGPGLAALTTQFLAPAQGSWPPPAPYEVTIQDPTQRYLARRATIAAPQPLPTVTPQGAAPPLLPVTTPQTIVLYPTPAAPLSPNWAVVRVSVVSSGTPPLPLPWAVIQLQGVGSPVPAGLTNRNGEALLAVPGLGLKLSSNNSGAVTETTTPATVAAWFDPAALSQPQGWIPNPDDILLDLSSAQWKSATQSVQLGPGQTVFVTLTISL